MGGKSSKQENNKDFKKIGEQANKTQDDDLNPNTIRLTNDIIVGHLKNDPGED